MAPALKNLGQDILTSKPSVKVSIKEWNGITELISHITEIVDNAENVDDQ